jgi:hypothetical protein
MGQQLGCPDIFFRTRSVQEMGLRGRSYLWDDGFFIMNVGLRIYCNSIFARVSINLVIFLLVYLSVVRPLRMQVTAKVVFPMLSSLFKDSTEVLLSPGGPGVQMKFQGTDDRIEVITPFGAYWGIPFVLFASTRSWALAKMLTYYHVTVAFVLPLLFSLFFMQWIWTFIPTDISYYLTQFLGMSFCIVAFKELYDEHCRIRKAISVDEGA